MSLNIIDPRKLLLSILAGGATMTLPVAAMTAGPASDPVYGPASEKAGAKGAKQKQTPPPTIDTDGDGKADAWDRDGNGVPDAWDTDGDGKPDLFDEDGDGKPDERAG